MTMMSKPGKEKIVEKASAALNFKTFAFTKSDPVRFIIFQSFFGDINGKIAMTIINHT